MNAYSFHTFNSLQIVQSKAIKEESWISEMLKEPVVSVLEQLKLALWVEVVSSPNAPTTLDLCVPSQLKSRLGYIEDLKQESAQVIAVTFNRVQGRANDWVGWIERRFENQLSPHTLHNTEGLSERKQSGQSCRGVS